jgi:hypothetical protein
VVVTAYILLTCVVLFSPVNIGLVVLSLLFLSAICKDASLLYSRYFYASVCYFFIYNVTCRPIAGKQLGKHVLMETDSW